MPKIKKTPANTIVAEGVEAFPENQAIIDLSLITPVTVQQLLADFHPKYHGPKRAGCILVKKRREKTYQDHYLDIYGCLTCGLEHECLHSGWEIGYWGGRHVSTLKSNIVPVVIRCTECGERAESTNRDVLAAIKKFHENHDNVKECKKVELFTVIDDTKNKPKTFEYYPNYRWRAIAYEGLG